MVDSVVKSARGRLAYEMIKVPLEVSQFLQMEFQGAGMPGPAGPGRRDYGQNHWIISRKYKLYFLNPAYVQFQVTDSRYEDFPEKNSEWLLH